MTDFSGLTHVLQKELLLPCGAIFKNRLAKSPMSDSLGDGEGNPTESQNRLYERWAEGGTAVSFVGEVQGDPLFPEKPGNLVLGKLSNLNELRVLTSRAQIKGAHLWAQIGHAGALSDVLLSRPKGPSPLDLEGLICDGMSLEDVRNLPDLYAKTATFAKIAGFSGVHIHAGHGFLLSQFLSPLFNHRTDFYGGSIEARCSILLEIIDKVRQAVGPLFPIGIRINSTDQLEGGLTEADAIEVVRLLDETSIDLIDISGGTYFPGAKASSERASQGPYFLSFAKQAKKVTRVPLMVTGGFKKRDQAIKAILSGSADIVGLGRAMALNPHLPETWMSKAGGDPEFPVFETSPPGGITAWYTMRLKALAEDNEFSFKMSLLDALQEYEQRDAKRRIKWKQRFSNIL